MYGQVEPLVLAIGIADVRDALLIFRDRHDVLNDVALGIRVEGAQGRPGTSSVRFSFTFTGPDAVRHVTRPVPRARGKQLASGRFARRRLRWRGRSLDREEPGHLTPYSNNPLMVVCFSLSCLCNSSWDEFASIPFVR